MTQYELCATRLAIENEEEGITIRNRCDVFETKNMTQCDRHVGRLQYKFWAVRTDGTAGVESALVERKRTFITRLNDEPCYRVSSCGDIRRRRGHLAVLAKNVGQRPTRFDFSPRYYWGCICTTT